MNYQALYRKFRPQTFDEVKGQDAIVTTLKNQIKNERVGHAYLFCGTRGTGKTSIAKLFAKSINCDNPVDGSPCGECPTCKKISAGISLNVIEMDAASNNGVDDIRQIVEEVTYSPTEGKYKVYIIDEVHMLSTNAFNALLKTLEEPPSYVVFILATTDVYKIPITILSRCQRYDFKRISIDTITNRMKELVSIEGIAVEDRALKYIAKCADGSMRDGLSLLDQCIAFYFGQELTYDKALEVLGAVDTEVYSRMLRTIISQDIIGAIHLLEELVMQGRELTQFVSDFTWYLRNLLLVGTAENVEDVIDVSAEHKALLIEESQLIDDNTLMRYIRVLSDLSGQIKFSSQKRVLIEVAIIKLCRPAMEADMGSVLDRIRQLEEKLEGGVVVQGSPELIDGVHTKREESERREKVPLPAALPEDINALLPKWRDVISEIADENGMVGGFMRTAKPSVEGDRLVIVFDGNTSGIALDTCNEPDNKQMIKNILDEATGHDVEFSFRKVDDGRSFDEVFPDILKSKINFGITQEE